MSAQIKESLSVERGRRIAAELSTESSVAGSRSRHDPCINDNRGSSIKSTAVTENPSSTKYLIAGESPHKGTNARRGAGEEVVSTEKHRGNAGFVKSDRAAPHST